MVDDDATDVLRCGSMTKYHSERDIVLVLALESKADPRTIRKWIKNPQKVVPSLAASITAVADRLDLTQNITSMREASR